MSGVRSGVDVIDPGTSETCSIVASGVPPAGVDDGVAAGASDTCALTGCCDSPAGADAAVSAGSSEMRGLGRTL